jgi:ADP-ribose pyrophosphatase YjhB (NUDIX family)
MPEITVAALVTGADGVLFVRGRGEAEWRLPGGLLLPADETVEAALARGLAAEVGLLVEDEPPFLETFYERRSHGATVVHNVFDLRSVDREQIVPAPHIESSWVAVHELDALAVGDWLRRALRSVFFDETDELSLDALQQAVDAALTPAPVIIVTGPAGAGKTSVARELCRRFARSAHVEVDRLRDMIRSGYESPVPGENGRLSEAAFQIELAQRNAAALARNFTREQFTTVIDDVLETEDDLNRYIEALGPSADIRFLTLLPDAETLAQRDAGRPPAERIGARSEDLRRIFVTGGETRGLRLNTSALGVEASVDMILERLEEARVTGGPEETPP